jgi:hypothetical protein
MLEGDIEFAMYQMAAKHFRPPLRLVKIEEERPPFVQLPDEDSYQVLDDLEQMHGLVKIYLAEGEEEEKKVADIMRGIRGISALELKESIPTSPIDFEKAKVESQAKQFIALFTIPEGRSLFAHINYLSKQKDASIDRQQALDIVKAAYQQLAKALGELHTKKFSPVCTISPYYWESHMQACQAAVKSLRNNREFVGFDLEVFAQRLIRMAAEAYVKPCSAAFLHGDPLVSSIAYEPFSGDLALLNLEKSCYSMDARGMPCGPSAYDFVWAEASFELQMACSGGDAMEALEILSDYRGLYKEIMRARFPSSLHLTFYSVLFWLPIYRTLISKHQGNEKGMGFIDRQAFRLARTKIDAVFKFNLESIAHG